MLRNALVTRLKALLSVFMVLGLLFTPLYLNCVKSPYTELPKIEEIPVNTGFLEVSMVARTLDLAGSYTDDEIDICEHEVEVVEAAPIEEEPDYGIYGEPVLMRATCYTATGNLTADSSVPREGYLAGMQDWLGYSAILYDTDMNLIGIFEFRDTGFGIDLDGDGIGSLQNGTSIDIYRDTLDRCYDWIGMYGDYVYVQIFRAEG